MLYREDYFKIIKFALLEFGIDIMVYVIMILIAWDVLIYMVLKEEEDKDDVLISEIRCADEKNVGKKAEKVEQQVVKKKREIDGMIGELPGESQGGSNVERVADCNVDRQIKPKKVHNGDVKQSKLSDGKKRETNRFNDRVEMSFKNSISCIRCSGRVMVNGATFFSECKTSIIWSCYVVEGSSMELLRIRYDKKRKTMTSKITKGKIEGLQKVAMFNKEDIVSILAIFKLLCKIKRY